MPNYTRPIVTYEEIVDAIKSIIECSLSDNSDYLNTKYDAITKSKLDVQSEEAVRRAIKSLERAIDSSNRVIKNNLENELKEIYQNIYQIHADYLIGEEKRKIAASHELANKLSLASLDIDVLNEAPQYETNEIDLTNVDTNKIFSDFERKVVINFPDFFREELAIARGEDLTNLDNLYDTVELEPTSLNNKPKKIDDTEYHFIDAKRVILIRKAINKAKERKDLALVEMLEKRLDKELGVEK